jgi:hypothetical protein
MKNKARASLAVAFILFSSPLIFAQADSIKWTQEAKAYQENLNAEYKDKDKSPLDKEALEAFKAHEFFPVNLKFRVVAKLKLASNSPFFKMKTTTMRLDEQRIYGMLEFTIDGKKFELPVYQSSSLMTTTGYRDYLFLPFTDLTNSKETYEGGRYIDLQIPVGDEMVIDFNKAYNPYCAYGHRFSCPIVPAANRLPIAVEAGIKYAPKK